MLGLTSTSDLPSIPAVYAVYGGRGRGLYIASVGVEGGLKRRISEYLVRPDSSVATGTSAVMLNPNYVTELRWWEQPDIGERHALEAAELVACGLRHPVRAPRPRGAIEASTKRRLATACGPIRLLVRRVFGCDVDGRIDM